MNIERIDYINQNFKDDLLKKLFGTVFHVTTKTAFEQIQKDGYVYHNRNGRFGLNTGSKKSFGLNNGWICLFDLRNENKTSIEETLEKYFFLRPSWFIQPDFMESNLVYLFLHPNEYYSLIPNEIAKSGQYVPKTECWFPGDMPLTCVIKALHVRIIQDADPHLKALLAVSKKRKKYQ